MWYDTVFNIVVCTLLFLAGSTLLLFVIFLVDEYYKHLVFKALLFVGALILALQAVKYASQGKYCIAALLNVYALFMVFAAIHVF